jgi:hypothetical protein
MTDFKTFGEACGELIRGWEKKMTETKRCTKCGRELPLSEFYRDDAHSDGRHSCCRGCIKKTRREAFLRNVELSRALKKADETLGGWKAYGLKHPKPGEYKYNIVFTDGRLFRTNDIKIFRGYLLEL